MHTVHTSNSMYIHGDTHIHTYIHTYIHTTYNYIHTYIHTYIEQRERGRGRGRGREREWEREREREREREHTLEICRKMHTLCFASKLLMTSAMAVTQLSRSLSLAAWIRNSMPSLDVSLNTL